MNLPDFFGLDISQSSIKIAHSQRAGDGYQLLNLGSIEAGKNMMFLKDTQEKTQFAMQIKKLKDSLGIKSNKVVAALPEPIIFTKILTVPDIDEEMLEKLLYFEAKNQLPVSVETVQLDHIPIAKKEIDGKKFIQLLLVAAPKTFVNLYLEILSLAKLELIALETESIATSRVFSLNKEIKEALMIVDFGALTMSVIVIKGKNIVFSQSINTGSVTLTQAVARDYNLSMEQAEQYKKLYGLTNQIGGKIFNSLNPVMQIIVNELNKIINYVNINLVEFIPQRFFITGQGSLLPGLQDYLVRALGRNFEMFDPVLSSFSYTQKVKDELVKSTGLGYSVAVGLSIKEK